MTVRFNDVEEYRTVFSAARVAQLSLNSWILHLAIKEADKVIAKARRSSPRQRKALKKAKELAVNKKISVDFRPVHDSASPTKDMEMIADSV